MTDQAAAQQPLNPARPLPLQDGEVSKMDLLEAENFLLKAQVLLLRRVIRSRRVPAANTVTQNSAA